MKGIFLVCVLLFASQQDSCESTPQEKDNRVEQLQPTPETKVQPRSTPETYFPAQSYEEQRTAKLPKRPGVV